MARTPSWRTSLAHLIAGTSPRPRRPVTAAAMRVPLDRNMPIKPLRRSIEWQDRSWFMFDNYGLVKAPNLYASNQIARIPWFPAIEMPGEEEPVPISDAVDEVEGVTQQQADVATGLLNRLTSEEGGVAEFKRRTALNLSVAGELYWLLEDETPEQRESCMVLSVDEIRYEGNEWRVVTGPSDPTGRKINPESSELIKVWKRHGRFQAMPDSNLRAVLDDLEELRLICLGNKAIAQSRIAQAGILLIDSRVDVAGAIPETMDSDVSALSAFGQMLAQVAQAAISTPGTAAAQTPVIVEVENPGDGTIQDMIAHLTFDRPLADATEKRYAELVLSIIRGLDWPPEFYTGLGDTSTYANARIVTQEGYYGAMDPPMLLMCEAAGTEWVRPGMAATGIMPPDLLRRLIVWRDPSDVIYHPDMAKNALEVAKVGELSGQALRKASGFSEADAPDDDERAAFAERARPRPTSDATTREGPNADAAGQELSAPKAIETTGRDVTATMGVAHPAASTDGSDAPAPVGASVVLAAASSAQSRLDLMSNRLAQIDNDLRARLTVAADRSVDRALSATGARLRARVQGKQHQKLKDSLATVDNRQVAATLGPTGWEQLAVGDPADTIDLSAFDDLAGHYDRWTQAAQRSALATARRGGAAIDDRELDVLHERQDSDRRTGWALFAASLLGLARGLVHDPNPVAPTVGEFDPTVSVPTAMVRQSLAVAGGAPPMDRTDAGGLPMIGDRPAGEIGTGMLVSETLDANLDAQHVGWMWLSGDPLVPFEPHQDLDGVSFKAWDDPVLANSEGWPPVDSFYPGDHFGCCCSTVMMWELPDEG